MWWHHTETEFLSIIYIIMILASVTTARFPNFPFVPSWFHVPCLSASLNHSLIKCFPHIFLGVWSLLRTTGLCPMHCQLSKTVFFSKRLCLSYLIIKYVSFYIFINCISYTSSKLIFSSSCSQCFNYPGHNYIFLFIGRPQSVF